MHLISDFKTELERGNRHEPRSLVHQLFLTRVESNWSTRKERMIIEDSIHYQGINIFINYHAYE